MGILHRSEQPTFSAELSDLQ